MGRLMNELWRSLRDLFRDHPVTTRRKPLTVNRPNPLVVVDTGVASGVPGGTPEPAGRPKRGGTVVVASGFHVAPWAYFARDYGGMPPVSIERQSCYKRHVTEFCYAIRGTHWMAVPTWNSPGLLTGQTRTYGPHGYALSI